MGVGPNRRTKKASVLGQIFADHEHVNSNIFSICLAEWGGRLTVGGPNVTYHKGPIQYVPLESSSGFYRVPLKSFALNGVVLASELGRTMIDSGTTYTYMSNSAYNALKTAIEEHCKETEGCGKVASQKCWNLPLGPFSLDYFPTFTVNIGNISANWTPQAYLYQRQTSSQWCYGFAADGFRANTVLGSTWMLHQDIIFDMQNSRVGIVPADCPNHKDRPARDPIFTTTPSTVVDVTGQASTPAATTAAPTPVTTPAATVAPTTKAPQATSTVRTTSWKPNQRSETTNQQAQHGTTSKPKGNTLPAEPSPSTFADLKLLVGGTAVVAAIAIFAGFYCIRKGKTRHKYVQQVDEPSSSMPPEIVGAGGVATAADDTFVIDDVDQWGEDDFDFGKEENALSLDEMSENIRLMFSTTSPRDLFHARASAAAGNGAEGAHDSCTDTGALGDGFETDPPKLKEGTDGFASGSKTNDQNSLDHRALD
mmetsp:Transcript_38513/g.83359  ORF Transcript_38513/g.83359 Transcript_38513/m.83359 type:complete len:481 (+) Transcript_38513:714-2156(+)